jgi:hypothetical protein
VAKSLSEHVQKIQGLYAKPKGEDGEDDIVIDEPAPIGFV